MARRRRRLLTSNQKRLTDTWPSGTTPTFVFSSPPSPSHPSPAPPARRRPLNVTSGRQRPDYTSADPGDEFEINDVAAAGDPQRMFAFAASGEDPPNTAAVTQAATHLGGQLHPPRPSRRLLGIWGWHLSPRLREDSQARHLRKVRVEGGHTRTPCKKRSLEIALSARCINGGSS